MIATNYQQYYSQELCHRQLPTDQRVRTFKRHLWEALARQFQQAKDRCSCHYQNLTFGELYRWMEATFGWNYNHIICKENFSEHQFDFDKDRVVDLFQFGKNVVLRVIQEKIHDCNRSYHLQFNQDLDREAFIKVLEQSFAFLCLGQRQRDDYQHFLNLLAINGRVSRFYFLYWRSKELL